LFVCCLFAQLGALFVCCARYCAPFELRLEIEVGAGAKIGAVGGGDMSPGIL
jgi:hypothetical protein